MFSSRYVWSHLVKLGIYGGHISKDQRQDAPIAASVAQRRVPCVSKQAILGSRLRETDIVSGILTRLLARNVFGAFRSFFPLGFHTSGCSAMIPLPHQPNLRVGDATRVFGSGVWCLERLCADSGRCRSAWHIQRSRFSTDGINL